MERYQEENKSIHIAFLDLEKVFDRILHELIWHTLHYHGVPEAYVCWIQLLYSNVTSVVQKLEPHCPLQYMLVSTEDLLSPFRCLSFAWK